MSFLDLLAFIKSIRVIEIPNTISVDSTTYTSISTHLSSALSNWCGKMRKLLVLSKNR